MIQLFDMVQMEGVRETEDGYLVAVAPVARTGIQLYAGYEVDPDNKHGLRDRATVRVYRSPSEVFKKDTLHSFAFRPVTNDHPPKMVDSKSWKQYSVGQTGGEVDASDGKFVRVPLVLMDEATIQDYRDGKRQLSMGYTTALDFNPGTTPDGEEYDVSQTDMRMNHLAVVRRARGGDQLRIGDNQGDRPMTDKTQTVVVDGISIETTTQGAQVINRLQKQLSDAADAIERKISAKDAEIAELNKQLATKDAEIDAAKKAVPDQAAMDAAVEARAQLVNDAKTIVPDLEVKGLSDADVRKAVVAKALGDAAVAGKPQSYIDARFDILVEDGAKSDKFDAALSSASVRTPASDQSTHDAAYASSVSNLNDWRSKASA